MTDAEKVTSALRADGHVGYECQKPCTRSHCQFCMGGLFACTLCGGLEGSVPTHCPKTRMLDPVSDLVYKGKLDFKDGKWIRLGCIPNEITLSLEIAIIGTRVPSATQIQAATDIAKWLSSRTAVFVKTGGAFGIDQIAMENVIEQKLMLYLPWNKYNKEIVKAVTVIDSDPKNHSDWMDSVEKFHPNAAALSPGSRLLQARNYGVVENTIAVCAFPKSRTDLGGTGQGMRIAKEMNIPVFSIFSHDSPAENQRILGTVKVYVEFMEQFVFRFSEEDVLDKQ